MPFRLLKNKFFDSLAAVKEAVKTSNSHSSAYGDTVEGELRSKSKRLALQGVADYHKKETACSSDELQSTETPIIKTSF